MLPALYPSSNPNLKTLPLGREGELYSLPFALHLGYGIITTWKAGTSSTRRASGVEWDTLLKQVTQTITPTLTLILTGTHF